MNFKEFILKELSGRNAYQRMVRQHPGYQTMPAHVRGEFINSALGHSVNSSSTKAMQAKSNGQKPPENTTKPSEFLNKSPYNNRQWTKKAEILQVRPSDFDENTLSIMINRCFGFRPLPTIRNDLARMNHQQGALNVAMVGKNEPVIMLQDNGKKIKLQEGWHRTMSILVWDGSNEYGAPPDQIQILKQYAQKLRELDQPFIDEFGEEGLTSNNQARLKWLSATLPVAEELRTRLDFSKWLPVPLRGFVGRMGGKTSSGSNPYDVGTAEFNPNVWDTSTAQM